MATPDDLAQLELHVRESMAYIDTHRQVYDLDAAYQDGAYETLEGLLELVRHWQKTGAVLLPDWWPFVSAPQGPSATADVDEFVRLVTTPPAAEKGEPSDA